MKKIVLISMIGLLLFGCGQPEQTVKEDTETVQTEQITADKKDNQNTETDDASNQKETDSDTNTDLSHDKAGETNETDTNEMKANEFSFADISNITFEFSSGVGGWCTYLYVQEDGSFYGNYHDSDMGCNSAEYPNGTLYYCDFSGKFTSPQKVDDNTYEFEIESLECAEEEGKEEIIDEMLYIYSAPYGLDEARKIYLYLPGTPTNHFSEDLKMWLFLTDDVKELPFYAIYNENPGYGFIGYEYESIYNQIMEDLDAIKKQTEVYEENLTSGYLSQIELNQTSREIFTCWDDELNKIWSYIKSCLPEDEYNTILAEQREWIQKKDAKAEAEASEFGGGSMYPLIYYDSEAASTRERCYELAEYLKEY